jgi:hypothetical protein
MFPAPLFLFLLILSSPLCLIFDGPLTYGLITAAAAVLVAIMGLRIRPGEAEFLSSLIRPVALVAVLPALAILIQLMPLRSIGLANSIWQSAATALSRPVIGSITVDPGATLICLARYLSLAGLGFVAAAVAIDRRRARWLLFALTTATALTALMLLAVGLGGAAQLDIPDRALLFIAAATNSAVLGIILAIAAALQTLERPDAPSQGQDNPVLVLLVFVLCLAALATCSLAVFNYATSGAYFALAFGVATFVVALIIHRFQLDVWGYSAIVAIVVVVAIAALALRLGNRMTDFTLAFAASPQSPLIALTRRILAETSWLGTGAGTFAAILPVYRDINELAAGNVAPTAAAAVAIEMGKPFLVAAIFGAIALIIMLLRGAARRGRDSLYPTAGASCVVTMTILAFNNQGVFNTSVLVIVATTIGMAIAQSKSRSL